ncbi:hypothetical protein C2845_PM16G21070 [Panicum miliaceum]|uniref:Protein kinase domain-containing protein n=1 Tax=Panicum miliaceum TaxID=4540 RepID=A0A3L6PVW6_PANMI|nr:hypothetical protein C2845_PM16G21070 [Panicum miliaceum]
MDFALMSHGGAGARDLQTQRTTPAPTVPSCELSSLKKATGDFSESNVIGRGGFGIVYEGHLPDGRKVAVKRLIMQSSLTDEGANAFMREVGVMSKLRHGNLLQLLSYCQDGKERILVYEYMKNKSLNIYIFGGDPRLQALLNWDRRLEIVRGVAKGVAYLHGLSEEVIHRDLKSSNILLDDNWRPKIADFGTAKLFVVDETDPTLIKSAGYTAPEYLSSERHLTLKCDVYSFGVILMEIISGKRNTATPALLSDAWESWNQGTISDLLDPVVAQPEPELLFELERCVQIGLLCVQQSPDDRPAMSAVVAMLNSNTYANIHSTLDVPGARSCALSFPCIEHQHSSAHSVTSSSAPAPIVPHVDLLTLREATGYFSESNIIGRGGFRVLYEGRIPDGRKVAVKRIIQSPLLDEGGEAFMREVEAWESWNQHRITELLDSAVAQPEPELLFELDRCVQIGLLCVQQSPNDRPTMYAVVTMLNNSSSQIRGPKRLVFDAMTEPPLREADHSAKEGASSMSNGSHTIYLS